MPSPGPLVVGTFSPFHLVGLVAGRCIKQENLLRDRSKKSSSTSDLSLSNEESPRSWLFMMSTTWDLILIEGNIKNPATQNQCQKLYSKRISTTSFGIHMFLAAFFRFLVSNVSKGFQDRLMTHQGYASDEGLTYPTLLRTPWDRKNVCVCV